MPLGVVCSLNPLQKAKFGKVVTFGRDQHVPCANNSRTCVGYISESLIHVRHAISHQANPVRILSVHTVSISTSLLTKVLAYPITVNGFPLSTNFCPETPTKPVDTGVGGAVDVGPEEGDDRLEGGGAMDEIEVGGGATEVGFTLMLLLAVPGKHWK